MQRAIVLHAFRDRRLDAIGLRHVRADENRVAPGLGDDLRGLFPSRDVQFRDDHPSTLGCHFLSGGAADAGAGPCDERDFACQTCHYRLNSRVISSIPATVRGNIRPSMRSLSIEIDRTCPQLCFGVGFNHAALR